jgi:NUMOD3 motif-containing protein
MKDYVVYWLFDETCKSRKKHGYIGVTCQLKIRISNHRKRQTRKFLYRVIFKGTKEECLAYEKRLRPTINIGWNTAVGGNSGYLSPQWYEATKASWKNGRVSGMTGKKHSSETIRKMKAARHKMEKENRVYRGGNGGHRHTEETKAKLRAARLSQPDPRLGQHHSEETKVNQSKFATNQAKYRQRNSNGQFA